MKWEAALWNESHAEDYKNSLEIGDIIGLNELLNSLIDRSNYYREIGEDKGPCWRTLRKLSALVTAAIQLNPIVVDGEIGEQPFDMKFDDLYHEIMYNIHDYLIKIIDQEVK